MRIGVDTGGTFTDFIFEKGDTWGVLKILSTPDNPAEAVISGIDRIARDTDIRVVHGSTVATNTILEKKGARTALVTNSGFTDIIEIGRQNRERLYDLTYSKNAPPVPPERRFGVAGRIDKNGTVITEIDENRLTEIAARLSAERIESVAVCFLFSFLNPEHEKTAGRILSTLQVPVSLSHEILSEFREYERTATTVINAYVSPKIAGYLTSMTDRIPKDRLRIMQSNGGSISSATASKESVRTILSGPAGGVVGAFETGKAAGITKLITFDMGGTSTDVSLVNGRLPITVESSIGGFPVKVPMIDIHTVGAGGGSIAALDAGGALTVGPESAGADPGPVCYGRGDRITVTDANLFLGRLLPDHFLGGRMRLNTEKLNGIMEQTAMRAGLTPAELAHGVLAVANTTMEKAIRVISVEKGYDPGEFTLLSFGGAGGMHAAFLARLLSIPTVLIPKNPGILSAFGMLSADIVKDYSITIMRPFQADETDVIEHSFAALESRGIGDLIDEGLTLERIQLERFLDMRYHGQSYEIIVPYDADVAGRFHRDHQRLYGYSMPEMEIEIVNIRLRAVGVPDKPAIYTARAVNKTIDPAARLGKRPVRFDAEPVETEVYAREKMTHGNVIDGPALVVEYSSTIVIPPFASARVDVNGNIIVGIVPQAVSV